MPAPYISMLINSHDKEQNHQIDPTSEAPICYTLISLNI